MKAITIELSQAERNAADAFARKTLKRTYNRRRQNDAQRHRNIVVGKLGEIALARHIKQQVGYKIIGRFETDGGDFVARDKGRIDVKTANRSYHKMILIPVDQFNNQPHPYYVAVRVSPDLKKAMVLGYQTRRHIQENGVLVKGRMDYPAYFAELSKLRPLEEIL